MVRYTWVFESLHPETGKIQTRDTLNVPRTLFRVFEDLVCWAKHSKFQRATAKEIADGYAQQRAISIRKKLVRKTTEKALRSFVVFTLVNKTGSGYLVEVADYRNCKHQVHYDGYYWVPVKSNVF